MIDFKDMKFQRKIVYDGDSRIFLPANFLSKGGGLTYVGKTTPSALKRIGDFDESLVHSFFDKIKPSSIKFFDGARAAIAFFRDYGVAFLIEIFVPETAKTDFWGVVLVVRCAPISLGAGGGAILVNPFFEKPKDATRQFLGHVLLASSIKAAEGDFARQCKAMVVSGRHDFYFDCKKWPLFDLGTLPLFFKTRVDFLPMINIPEPTPERLLAVAKSFGEILKIFGSNKPDVTRSINNIDGGNRLLRCSAGFEKRFNDKTMDLADEMFQDAEKRIKKMLEGAGRAAVRELASNAS